MSDVLVLCYHAVSPTWGAALSVTPEALERQLASLLRHGWLGATFREAVTDPPWPRTLVLTFDDAFASVKSLAHPILQSLGLRATVFAPTAFVSSGEHLGWLGVAHWEDTPHAAELSVMTWNDLGELGESGWEIGSHTRTHPHLSELDDRALAEELEQSRGECSRQLRSPCETIAYPYGDVDERVAASARNAGYLAGAALSRHLLALGAYRWPRVGVYHADADWRFRLKVARPLRALAWRREDRCPTPARYLGLRSS